MKKIIIIILCAISTYMNPQDRIIYIQKQDVNTKQLAEWQNKGQIIDQFTIHTNTSLIDKVKAVKTNWSRDAMQDLLKDFSISPDQFGIMLDTLSNVVIRQSNDVPNTKVGRIALIGVAWKIAGPSIFKAVTDTLFVIFFLWFFIWSYKRNFWTTIFITKKRINGFFSKSIVEKHEVAEDDLFDEDSWLSGSDGPFDSDIFGAKFMHISAFILLILTAVFIL